uniref:Uncharacterized protein n=1 Tax=Caenorhabditis japonica TaxID=281687 RepID=A0A8R1IMG8_CAEJA
MPIIDLFSLSAILLIADDQGNLTWDEEHLDMIRKWATAAESLIHGRASGLDAAVCTYVEPYYLPTTKKNSLAHLTILREEKLVRN